MDGNESIKPPKEHGERPWTDCICKTEFIDGELCEICIGTGRREMTDEEWCALIQEESLGCLHGEKPGDY